MRWLIADWGGGKGNVFDRLQRGVSHFGIACSYESRNDAERRQSLIDSICSGQFERIVTWQRFYPVQHDILDAISMSGIRTLFIDFGFVPHYSTVVLDPQGENATSLLAKRWSSAAERKEATDVESVNVPESAISSECLDVASAESMGLICPGKQLVFVPLQRSKDAVVRFDSSVRDMGALVRRVLALAGSRYYVVIKVHPLEDDIDIGVPDRLPGRHLVVRERFTSRNEQVSNYLLSQAAVVVGVNSNMLFRAVLLHRPVIAVGKGWFSGSGAVTEVEGVEGLVSLCARPCVDAVRRRYVSACLAQQLTFPELECPVALESVFKRIGINVT